MPFMSFAAWVDKTTSTGHNRTKEIEQNIGKEDGCVCVVGWRQKRKQIVLYFLLDRKLSPNESTKHNPASLYFFFISMIFLSILFDFFSLLFSIFPCYFVLCWGPFSWHTVQHLHTHLSALHCPPECSRNDSKDIQLFPLFFLIFFYHFFFFFSFFLNKYPPYFAIHQFTELIRSIMNWNLSKLKSFTIENEKQKKETFVEICSRGKLHEIIIILRISMKR